METRVLIVGMSEIIGGVEREVLAIISRCKNTSFDLLCYGSDYSYEKELPDCRFFYLPYRREHYFESQRKLKEFFVNHGNKYDCIWINTSSASNMSVQRIAKRYTNARVITHSHSSRIEHDNILLRAVHEILHKLNRRRMIKLSDVLIGCSESAAEHLFGKQHSNVHIIYNGIEVERFRFDPVSREEMRRNLRIEDSALVLSCVGRLESVKNVGFALKVFSEYQVCTTAENTYLLLVGDGSERTELERYVEERSLKGVIFLGQQKNVKPYLDASDILLMPSLFEGFPVSAVEAQANGLSCILSDKITREAAVTDLASFIGIGENDAVYWADIIKGFTEVPNRELYAGIVSGRGLDIETVTKQMEDIFSNRGAK